MAVVGERALAGTAILAVCVGAVAMFTCAGVARAADLSCSAPPGFEAFVAEGDTACGVRVGAASSAFARAIDGVAFARAETGGTAFGVAHSGGVAAAETTGGGVGAVSIGENSVAIVSPDPGSIALALSLERGQTFVGTLDEGVRCDAGPGLAVNFGTGQACLSDGVVTYEFPVSSLR